MDADGSVTIYKARLVAKGFRQVQGVDYDETFSLVAMLKVCWDCISSLADNMSNGCKTAFLNGFLKEELYMMQLGRFCRS